MWIKKRREAVRFTSQLFGWFQGVEGSGTSVAVWKGCLWPTRTGWLKLSWGFRLYLDISSQYSCLENPMDAGAWWAAVRGVAKSRTRLSDFTFTFHFHALEKAMATHSSTLAWRIPWTQEPGGLPSTGSHRVGHDWSDLAAAAACYLFIWLLFCFSIRIQVTKG